MSNDKRPAIQKKYSVDKRFNNFGNALVRLHAQGFRSHNNSFIELTSPITAFCGLNGCGKSTLLQLAAASYQSPAGSIYPQFSISDFMMSSRLDPRPFAENATVEFQYWNSERKTNYTTIKYVAGKGWSNYDNRPDRVVFFAGVGHYLPKVEQRDFMIQYSNQLLVDASAPVPLEVRKWTSTILACSYEEILTNTVRFQGDVNEHVGTLVSASQHGYSYSEAHMGYGEGRTLFLVNALENLPPKSLALIEEPETSLHAAAQVQLGRYLVDVVERKGHQILLTTHSMFLLSSLPLASLVLLQKQRGSTVVQRGLPLLEIRGHLTGGESKALYVFVEDEVALEILRAIIRRRHSGYLQVIETLIGGSVNTLIEVMKALSETSLPVACVLDGDQSSAKGTVKETKERREDKKDGKEDTKERWKRNIFKLPGTEAPEKELFGAESVKSFMVERYQLDLDDYSTCLIGVDHHDWFNYLARHLNQNRMALITETVQAYVNALSENETDALVNQLREASL